MNWDEKTDNWDSNGLKSPGYKEITQDLLDRLNEMRDEEHIRLQHKTVILLHNTRFGRTVGDEFEEVIAMREVSIAC